ncbi:MAG: FAD-dependent oxidoreductase, partial [Clostridia bacterium]|nr:FAD-dependent oxidoreductase [Clostridia bacterium]
MEKRIVSLEKDFVVIGGGLAGVCATLAAARHGLRVALCQDRSVLGGNSSSECRVWACGATGMGFNRYADETGIISELLQENLRRNPEGNPHLWDALLLDRVWAEENIQLLLE